MIMAQKPFLFIRFYIIYFYMEQKVGSDMTASNFSIFQFTITPITVPFTMNVFNFAPINDIHMQQMVQTHEVVQNQNSNDEGLYYFKSFFSPKDTAKSLQRRNQNLQMLSFQNSDGQEPDDVYNRRKKKVSDLMSQQQQQIKTLLAIKQLSQQKYTAIIKFVQLFGQLKQNIQSIRTDYYSNKTFCALKNSSQQDLLSLTRVMQRMFQNIEKYSIYSQQSFRSISSHISQASGKILQFLIIPRFLISKQKISRLIRDQQLQKNFQFLVVHECLGHYNNEANKKMPQQNHMKYVRELLNKKSGRQKFKKICSINHGNKFLKMYGQAYYNLYSQSLNYLQHLDNSLKRGKKYETIKKDLEKMAKQSEQTVGNSSSCAENQSSNGPYNFKSFRDCLKNIEGEEKYLNKRQQDQNQVQKNDIQRKMMVKKYLSTPIHQQTIQKIQKKQFKVRKFKTMQQKVTQNIILVSPPGHSEI